MHHFLKELPSCQDRNASQVVWIYVHVYWRSCIPLFVTPWTVVRQAPLSMGFVFQMRILEWVAISFSGGSSWLRDRTCLVSCVSGIMGGPFTCSFIREALFEFNCLINRALGYLAMILQVWFMTHREKMFCWLIWVLQKGLVYFQEWGLGPVVIWLSIFLYQEHNTCKISPSLLLLGIIQEFFHWVFFRL